MSAPLDPRYEQLRQRVRDGEMTDADRASVGRVLDAVHTAIAVCDTGEHRDSGIDGLWSATAREYRHAVGPELEP